MKYKLSDIAEFNPRESINKGSVAKKVAMDKLQPFCRDIPEYEYSEFTGGTKFRNGDTIMARITPCLENGKTAKVNILEDGEVGFGSTEYIVFRAKENITDEDYLYYLVCSPLVRDPAIKSMVGSSGRQRVQTDVVQNLEIDVPDLDTQRRIGGLLKSLDNKIAVNNTINKNLEQQAQAIFQSWFINFDQSDGEMPLSWHIVKLGDIATIKTNTFSPSKNPEIVLEHYSIPAYDEHRYPVFEIASGVKSNKYILTPQSVMISKLNPDTKRVWRPMCLSDNAVSSTEFIIFEANNPAYKDYIYSIIDSSPFSDWMCAHTTGSTNSRQRTTPSTTLEYSIAMADEATILNFCSIVTPMYEQIAQNLCENQRLSKLRDSLLPKLISGELDVSDIEL